MVARPSGMGKEASPCAICALSGSFATPVMIRRLLVPPASIGHSHNRSRVRVRQRARRMCRPRRPSCYTINSIIGNLVYASEAYNQVVWPSTQTSSCLEFTFFVTGIVHESFLLTESCRKSCRHSYSKSFLKSVQSAINS